jgi:ethanolamine ammonia-lyase small subunit
MPVDPWESLRTTTTARIGLDRTGDAPALGSILAFQLAHARARDAVHFPLDCDALAEVIAPAPSVMVRGQAPDRATYLRRPDLGRRLDPSCRGDLHGHCDIVFVLADGLSAIAVQRHAPLMLRGCLDRLPGWSIGPIVIATQARVALGDEIGECLGARLCAMLIGERPGLSAADSLGVYLTYEPKPGRRDSERNCISNIHCAGLSYAAAADMLVWLMTEAVRRKLTGVALKPDAGSTLLAPSA